MTTKTEALATQIRSIAKSKHATVTVRGQVVEVSIQFTPNSVHGFADAEMDAQYVIDHVPASGGSTWGTTGDGVGGAVALRDGLMVLKKSGCQKRICAALS